MLGWGEEKRRRGKEEEWSESERETTLVKNSGKGVLEASVFVFTALE
jgi:hypothetical protein